MASGLATGTLPSGKQPLNAIRWAESRRTRPADVYKLHLYVLQIIFWSNILNYSVGQEVGSKREKVAFYCFFFALVLRFRRNDSRSFRSFNGAALRNGA